MSDHSLSQIEDAMAAIIGAYAPLSAYSVAVSESLDFAPDDDQIPGLVIYTSAYSFDQSDEQGQTRHDAEIHVEAIDQTQATGTITRANRNALAHVVAAIAADRALGLGIQDIQEDDLAPVEPRGKDTSSASLRFRVLWFTPRDDHFTIA